MKAKPKRWPGFHIFTLLAGVVLLMVLFVSVGYFYTLSDTTDITAPRLDELRAKQREWLAKKPPAFRYEVRRDCRCDEAFRAPYIVTEDGPDISFRYSRNLENPNTVLPEPLTIDEVFALAEDALENADSTIVLYDALLAFPQTLDIDWSADDADDELRIEIHSFYSLH